ncbi:MAG: histidine kinase dimerization/phosphoacceptor domain -containing protein [Alkalispirochaeta sp.]
MGSTRIVTTILLVENETLVALNQKIVLQRNGFDVHIVHTGEKARHRIEHDDDIDLVLIDIELGSGLDGVETAEALLSARPLPIVFLTGHADRTTVERVRRVSPYGIVPKNAGEFVLVQAITMAEALFTAHHQVGPTSWGDRTTSHIESILLSAPTGIGIVVDRVIRRVNDQVCRMVGYSTNELVGNSVRILYPSDAEFEEVGREKYRQIIASGVGTVTTRWRKKDGSLIDVQLSSVPLNPGDPHGEYTFTAIDITERFRTERILKQAIEEKTRLLAELNHRVKNNLLIVSSLISLKESELDDSIDLSDLRSRVDTIRAIHDKLSTTDDGLEIDLATYAPDLIESIIATAPTAIVPEKSISIAPLKLPAKSAVSVGLVINELLTNAMKHAFPGEEHPSIIVRSTRKAAGYEIEIEHNGTPVPPSIDLHNPETLGLGLKLMTTLIAQLDGTIDHRTEVRDTETITLFTIELSI